MSKTALQLAAIAAEAGAIVMRHYRAGAGARWKDDRSPVTDADEEAETYILAALARSFSRRAGGGGRGGGGRRGL